MEIKVLLPLSASAFCALHVASTKQQAVAVGSGASSSSSERGVITLRVSPRATANALYMSACQLLALPAELANALYLFELDDTGFGKWRVA